MEPRKPLPPADRPGALPTLMWGNIPLSECPDRPSKDGAYFRGQGHSLLLPEGSAPTSTGKPIASLALAYQLTQRASKVGFDWPDIQGVLKKLDEELMEFREALRHRDPKRAQEELGDLLLVSKT